MGTTQTTTAETRTRRLAGVAIAGALGILAMSGCAASGGDGMASASPTASATASEESASLDRGSATAECAAGDDIVLSLGDGPALAVVYGDGPGIVIANQLNETLCSMDVYGRELAAAGYRVALIDANDSKPDALVAETAEWLRTDGTAQVGLLGASRGGTYALAATPGVEPAVTVALSPPAVFRGVDAQAAMPKITTPTMIVAGADDGRFPTDAEALGQADPEATVVVVPASAVHGHGFLKSDSPVRTQVLDFLKQHLG